MQSVCLTDIGKKRVRNEDCYFVDSLKGLYIICDGMGGHKGGDVASHTAVETIVKVFQDHPQETLTELLHTAIEKANEIVFQMGQENPALNEMGTTVTTALIEKTHLTIAHIGDSSLYILRDTTITKITRDHTLAEQMIAEGLLTQGEARESTYSHILTRALGIEQKVEIDIYHQELEVGDIVLLCTDGLSDMLDDYEISNIVFQSRHNINKAAQNLLEAALDKGGYDNITLILLFID